MQRLSRSCHTTFIGLVAAATLLAAPAALAHPGHEGGGDFVGGLVHSFTGLDHLLVMLGVGVWSAMLAKRAWSDVLWAPLGFVTLLLAGALLGASGVSLPLVEPMIAASLVVVGLLIATRTRMPVLAAAGIVAAFALFHGIAHGHEFAQAGTGTGAAITGMALATLLLHVAGIAFGCALLRTEHKPGRGLALRLAGSAVAVAGVVFSSLLIV